MNHNNGVGLRLTHLTLYRLILVFGAGNISLAVNLWASNPTFTPYNFDKNYVGVVFFLVGLWQLIFVKVVHSLPMTRRGLQASTFVMAFWGLANTQQFFAGNASLQLPIMYLIVAVVQGIILLALPVKDTTIGEDL